MSTLNQPARIRSHIQIALRSHIVKELFRHRTTADICRADKGDLRCGEGLSDLVKGDGTFTQAFQLRQSLIMPCDILHDGGRLGIYR